MAESDHSSSVELPPLLFIGDPNAGPDSTAPKQPDSVAANTPSSPGSSTPVTPEADPVPPELSRSFEFPPLEIIVPRQAGSPKESTATPESRASSTSPDGEQKGQTGTKTPEGRFSQSASPESRAALHQPDNEQRNKEAQSDGARSGPSPDSRAQEPAMINRWQERYDDDYHSLGHREFFPRQSHRIIPYFFSGPVARESKASRKERKKTRQRPSVKLRKGGESGVAQVFGESGGQGITKELGGLNSETPTKRIERRIKVGKEIAQFVAKEITSSNDVPWNFWASPFTGYQMWRTIRESERISDEYYEKEETYDLGKKLEEDNAKRALESGFGNCGAKASATAFLLEEHNKRNGIQERIEIMHFANDADHAWVVVGRDPNSDPQVPETWGLTAVVVDSWSGKVYEAGYFYSHLLNMNKVISRETMVYSQ